MENKNPLVSVLMTAYNREKYIAEAIESVLASTYTNFELIIIDDGSVDNTVQIIESFVALHSQNIKFFKNESNLGLVGNWNKCIDLATGDWIKFVFQDDYITFDCLEKFSKDLVRPSA